MTGEISFLFEENIHVDWESMSGYKSRGNEEQSLAEDSIPKTGREFPAFVLKDATEWIYATGETKLAAIQKPRSWTVGNARNFH